MSQPSQDPNMAPADASQNASAPVAVVVTTASEVTPPTSNDKELAQAQDQNSQLETESDDRSTATTPDPFVNDVNVVMSKPKTTAELIAARALKRTERRTALHEKAESHRQAGELLSSQKNYKAACTHYQEATKLWASNVDYLIALATVYRNLEWYEEAAHSATKALTLEPKNPEARYIRGIARLEQRLLIPAKVDFESVLVHEPDHLRARTALSEVNNVLEASTHLGTHSLGPNPVTEIVKDVDFGFPQWEQNALELASLSDSSDVHHVGNGIQCRFYNHEGCARASTCTFSHAPDEKSVRDDLGKNVCTYFLLDMCKFGATKCIYSHSKAALPQTKSGWWTSQEKIAQVKAVIELAEKNAREQRTLEKERWKEYIRSRKAAGGSKNHHPKSQQPGQAAENADTTPATQEEKAPASAKEDAAKPAPSGEKKTRRKPQGAQGTGKRNRTHGTSRRGDNAAKAAADAPGAPAEPATDAKEAVQDEPVAKASVEGQAQTAVNGTSSAPHPEKAPAVAEQKPAATEEAAEENAPAVQKPAETVPAPMKTAPSASGPGFVDYELNLPPAGVKPIVHQTDDPITLPY